ncbi:hypothetical protein [Herbiconiux solani]|uniref:hypothetical protein n=1 Tax=Herbiconiux solani TaxID=661329 RepID=UPI0012ECDC0E|nr:hypothetical protein [Herbiconiux solani]
MSYSGYAYPGYGQPMYEAPVPVVRKKTAGVIAFVVALVVLVAGPIVSAFVAQGIAPFMVPAMDGTLDPSSITSADERDLTAINSGISGVFILGTLLGLWAIVQGIVATVRKAGRAFGIAAMAIAVAAPLACGFLFYVTLFAALPPDAYLRP